MTEDPDGHGASDSHDIGEPPDRRTLGQQAMAAIRIFAWLLLLTSLGRNGMVFFSMGILGA